MNLNPKKTATYTWTADGGTISGTSSTANIDTKTAAPGTYTVKGHVTEGASRARWQTASASYTVKQFEPPTDQLLGESFDGCSGRFLDDYRELV